MKYVIDRFEGDFAVCENEEGKMVNMDKKTLPLEAKEGDVIIFDCNGVSIDKEETTKRRKRINELAESLWE